MILEPCTHDHVLALDLQPAQQALRQHMTRGYLDRLLGSGCAYAVVDDKPVLCFGFHPWTQERGCVWAYFSCDARRHMVALHRYAERFLTTLSGRIFATVQCGFTAGARWVDLLGFDRVGHLPEYGPAKKPHDVYLWVRS